MFPTLAPEPAPSLDKNPGTRPVANVANTAALPEDAPIAGAQVAGLAALALAFVLAVTRLSARRRPAAKPTQETADKLNAATTGKPADQQGNAGAKETGEAVPPPDGE